MQAGCSNVTGRGCGGRRWARRSDVQAEAPAVPRREVPDDPADVGKGHDRFCIVDYGVGPEPGYPTVQEPGATILGVVAEDGADRHRVWADRDDGDGSTLGLGACVRPTGAIGEPDPGDDDGPGLQLAVGRRLERLPAEEAGSGLGFDRSDRRDEAMATRSPPDRSAQARTVPPPGVADLTPVVSNLTLMSPTPPLGSPTLPLRSPTSPLRSPSSP